MRTTVFLTVSLLACAVVRAGEEDLVRFQEQTIRMAEALDAAVVTVNTRAEVAGRAYYQAVRLLSDGELRDTPVAWFDMLEAQPAGQGVLVGSPPRIVVPHDLGRQPEITARLADGREVKATRLAQDANLGLAVYALPDDVELAGLDVERDWASLRAGAIVMSRHTRLDLSLVQEEERALGRIRALQGPAGLALVTVHGRLAGLAAGARGVAPIALRSGRYEPLTAARLTYVNLGQGDSYVAGPVIARVLDDLAEHGRIRRGYLGVVLGDEQGSEAVRIDSVLDGSPAAGAGLKSGQRISSVDGVPCSDSATLSRVLALKRPGESVQLRIGTGDVEVVLADRAQAQATLLDEGNLGFACVDLGSELRGFLGLPDDVRGAVVQEVQEGGIAARAGLRRGDVIVGGGDGDVADVAELRAVLASAKGKVSLRVLRDGRTFDVDVALTPPRAHGTR